MTLKETLLWPFALPYGAVSVLRAQAYRAGILRQRRLGGIVISVGNLTTGGTGKTPMVLWIAQRLLAEGKRAGILTRGYRGESSPTGSTSDEVQLLQSRLGDGVAFGVGPDRFAHGEELAKRGTEWFVLDDGFQHLQLLRDVDIVLVDATNPFGGGRLLPAGRLREPKSALARAEIIVITRSDHAPALEASLRRNSQAPVFYARPQLESIHKIRDGYPGAEDKDARSRKYFAFCGIGNPSAFRADLRAWGLNVAGQKVFPDHHRYTTRDVREIESEARAAGADALLCTEKDIFNLADARMESFDVSYCRITLRIEREEDLWRSILALAGPRSKSVR